MPITVLPDSQSATIPEVQSQSASGAALSIMGALSLLAGLMLGVDQHNWRPHSAWIMAGAALLSFGASRSGSLDKRTRTLCRIAAVAMALLGVCALCRWVL